MTAPRYGDPRYEQEPGQYAPDVVERTPQEQARHRDGLDMVAALMVRRTDPDWERLGGSVAVPRWWQPPGVTDEEMDTAIARGLWRWERE